MNQDLTVGAPAQVLRRFCLPLFGSVIFQQLYNVADTLVAGQFISEDALSAVGNSYEVTLLFLAFAFGCNIGCSVIVSQLFGAGKHRELKTAVYTTLISVAVLCAVLMAAGLLFSGELLRLIHTPEKVLSDSRLYLDIYIWGLPFVFFYNIATGIFSALGDSRTPFYFLMVSSVVNIGMDILFTTALSPFFPRGVDGVAWATFLCQGVSCILSLVFVFRRLRTIPVEGRIPVFSARLLRRISAVAVPSILQQSFISVGNIIIQGYINGFGSGVMAGYSVAVKLNNLVITSLSTIANGLSNYTGQNLGAGKPSRVSEGYRAGLKLVWCICLPFALLYFFTGSFFVHIFLDTPTAEALSTCRSFLRIVAPFYFVVAAKLVSDGVLRGAGRMRAFLIATFTDLILRVVLAGILSGTALGSVGIWCAWPIGWSIATVLSVLFYRRGAWKTFPAANEF